MVVDGKIHGGEGEGADDGKTSEREGVGVGADRGHRFRMPALDVVVILWLGVYDIDE